MKESGVYATLLFSVVLECFSVEEASDDPRWFEPGSRLLADGTEVEVVAARRGGGGRPVIRLDRAVARGAELSVPRKSICVELARW